MKHLTSTLLSIVILTFTLSATQAEQALSLPPELQPWQDWVLHDHKDVNCPFLYSSPSRSCVWPSKLHLNLKEKSGTFKLVLQIYGEQWVPLPGGSGYWPTNVKNATKTLSVVQKNNKPFVFLTPGSYQLTGEWHWQKLPTTLPVSPDFGLLSVVVNNHEIANPGFASEGQLWLTSNKAEIKKTDRDSLEFKVFRHIDDSNPMKMTTLLQLIVSGKEREIEAGPILLPGFKPQQLQSLLPARIESDGRLRTQIKAGRWEIRLIAYNQTPLSEITYSANENIKDNPWPQQEIWVFSPQPSLRTVQITGAESVDPSQTQLPGPWKSLPAYIVSPNSVFGLSQLHRGDPNPASNQLSLNRTLWLDFDGDSYTLKDSISGILNQGDRIEAEPPIQLGQVELNGQAQLITQLSNNSRAGIEIRSKKIELSAISRLKKTSPISVTGWNTEFDQVNTTINLPPGWSLFHASGADYISGSWLGKWTLWNIFLVLIISVSIAKISKPLIGLLTLATLIITFQYNDAPLWIWLNLAAILALLPYTKGRFKTWMSGYWWLSFSILTLILLPLSVNQVRKAIYLQLEKPWQTVNRDVVAYDRVEQEYAVAPMATSGSAKEMEPMSKPVTEKVRRLKERTQVLPSSISIQQTYDSNQKVQVGPGLPNWQWNSVNLSWSGPVLADEKTKILLVSPLVNRLSLLLSIILPTLLGGLLLKQYLQQAPLLSALKIKQTLSSAFLFLLLFTINTDEVEASVQINNELLLTLENRLTAAPKCIPTCVSIEAVNVFTDDKTIKIDMIVNSEASIALPLPATWQTWWPTTITVNDKTAPILQSRDNQLYLHLEKGHFLISISGNTGKGDAIDLPFNLPLNNVSSQLDAWTLSGIPTEKQVSQSLQLLRKQSLKIQKDQDRLLPDPIPPYVMISRRLELGLEWRITTQVDRVAPIQGPIHLSIPLIDGEAPTSGELDSNGNMRVHFTAGQQSVIWHSALKYRDSIDLTASTGKPWSEVWLLNTSGIWHSELKGIPQIASAANDPSSLSLAPIWQPWPGETVSIHITRPKAIEGRHFAINSVDVEQRVGKRADDVTFTFKMKATQGGQYDFELPENAIFKGLKIDGRDSPISHTQTHLQIPVKPGEHKVQISWQVDTSQQSVFGQMQHSTPSIDLKDVSTNINLNLQLPYDTWLLVVAGPAMGPAILFWGILAVVLFMAYGLGRSGLTPLKSYEWILLSLGVCTFNLYVLALIAAWLITLHFRGKKSELPINRKFNVLQAALFAFSIIALASLISSIPASLLSQPDMMVTGNGSSATQLMWYQDQATNKLPQAWAISLPIMVYRIAMLLWSLWLAFALMRWLPWAWQQLGVQGYWYNKPQKKVSENEKLANEGAETKEATNED